jgi:ribonuclease P protein component
MGDFSFPPQYHLRRPSEFQSVYRKGAKRLSPGLVVYRLANDLGHPRLGLSVSRRFGGAVRRNRLKRLVREAMRQNRDDWNVGGSDIVVVARTGARGYGYSDVTSDLANIFSRYGRRSS